MSFRSRPLVCHRTCPPVASVASDSERSESLVQAPARPRNDRNDDPMVERVRARGWPGFERFAGSSRRRIGAHTASAVAGSGASVTSLRSHCSWVQRFGSHSTGAICTSSSRREASSTPAAAFRAPGSRRAARRRRARCPLFQVERGGGGEEREDADHDDRGAGDDGGRARDPVADRLVVGDAVGSTGRQLDRVAGMDVPREHEDADIRMGLPDCLRRLQSLVGDGYTYRMLTGCFVGRIVPAFSRSASAAPSRVVVQESGTVSR